MEAAKGVFVFLGNDRHGLWQIVTDTAVMQRCLDSGEPFYRMVQKQPNPILLKDAWDGMFGPVTKKTELAGEMITVTKVVHQYEP